VGLVEAVRERGTTVLLVTHFMDEAQALCDRLAVLVAGRIIARGTPGELVAARQHGHVVRFTAVATDVAFLPAVGGGEEVRAGSSGEVVVTGSGPLLARVGHALVSRGIEPEDLRSDVASLEDAYLALTGEAPHAGSRA
jgi:ABC-2 type transport system ATP-binding protein